MDNKVLRIELDELWEKYNETLDQRKELEARFEDLESQWSIIWRFYIGPLYEKFYEVLQALQDHEPEPIETRTFPGESLSCEPGQTLEKIKELYTRSELDRLKGNKMQTARSLNINVKTLYNLLKTWEEKAKKERNPTP